MLTEPVKLWCPKLQVEVKSLGSVSTCSVKPEVILVIKVCTWSTCSEDIGGRAVEAAIIAATVTVIMDYQEKQKS